MGSVGIRTPLAPAVQGGPVGDNPEARREPTPEPSAQPRSGSPVPRGLQRVRRGRELLQRNQVHSEGKAG